MTEQNTSTTLPEGVKVKIEKPKKEKQPETLQAKLAKLMVPVPEQFLETYTDDGTEFKGYKAQYAINLLNEMFGLGEWGVVFNLDKVENMNRNWLSYGTVRLYYRGVLLADGIGGAYAKRIENSLKGCKTSAFKNACRYLGIGNELYLAGHDEDITYETLPTAEAEVPTTDVPNEIKGTLDLINTATNVAQLEMVLPIISKTEGKAVKDLLIKQFNQKKIQLMDKK
jgi:hypothetical protein